MSRMRASETGLSTTSSGLLEEACTAWRWPLAHGPAGQDAYARRQTWYVFGYLTRAGPMPKISEDTIVIGSLAIFTVWGYVGLPLLLYLQSEPGSQQQSIAMTSTNWTVIVFSFVGGSLATFIVNRIVSWWERPVLSAQLVDGKGCYVTTSRGNPPTHQARFLRLLIENKGRSPIKNCTGYIIDIARIEKGQRVSVQQEVLELCWSSGSSASRRSIPRGAFFYIDVASLDLIPGGHVLQLCASWFPNHLIHLLTVAGTLELNIKIAAENVAPIDRKVRFEFGPHLQELIFRFD
jgi:hypothetical protein